MSTKAFATQRSWVMAMPASLSQACLGLCRLRAPPLPTLPGSKAFVPGTQGRNILALRARHDCMVSEPELTADVLLRFA